MDTDQHGFFTGNGDHGVEKPPRTSWFEEYLLMIAASEEIFRMYDHDEETPSSFI